MEGSSNKSFTRAKPMAELLPELNGIMIRSNMHTLTAKKQARSTIALVRTAEKAIKPMTIAEMNIQALSVQRPKNISQAKLSNQRKWNSSVKVDKKFVNHTNANDDVKHKSVRKVLNFPSKPKALPVSNTKETRNMETPKFPRPEIKVKKSVHQGATNKVRISGICNIPETPMLSSKPIKNRMTLANKENFLCKINSTKKTITPVKPPNNKRFVTPIPDTPLHNEYSCNDSSFLMKEKEINDFEEKTKAMTCGPTLEHIRDISSLVSTPFNGYRNVQEYFSNSSNFENSFEVNDNTIMSFDKPSEKENVRRESLTTKDFDNIFTEKENIKEESVILSLCTMLNNASVTNSKDKKTELNHLIDIEKQTAENIKRLENAIQELAKIREAKVKTLHCVRRLIEEKTHQGNKSIENVRATIIVKNDINKPVSFNGSKNHELPIALAKPNESIKDSTTQVKEEKESPDKNSETSRACSVIKSCIKTTYKIPRKSICLRKKVFHKSLPNISGRTPDKEINNKALNMYMEIKGNMPFLNSPGFRQKSIEMPDTPAVTSHNLQRQLDKLYNRS